MKRLSDHEAAVGLRGCPEARACEREAERLSGLERVVLREARSLFQTLLRIMSEFPCPPLRADEAA